MSAVICGSLAYDTIMVFQDQFKNHILPDQMHILNVSFLVPAMRREFGGCAGNIAYNLRLLGGHPVPVGTVGADAADYLARMRELGIDTRLVRVIPEMYTPQCFITTDLDNNQIAAFHPGAMQCSADNDLGQAEAAWAIVAPDAKEGMFAHARRLKDRGIPFIFDLGQAMPLFSGADIEEMLGLADILTANDYEASVVEQRTGRSMQDIARGLRAAVVTRGAEGATLYADGEQVDIAPVRAEQVVDPTGCGDAHRAGLLYGLIQQWKLADACRLANVMGALKIASRGPQNHRPSREQIGAMLQHHYGLDL